MIFLKWENQRPLRTFPKIHPFWWSGAFHLQPTLLDAPFFITKREPPYSNKKCYAFQIAALCGWSSNDDDDDFAQSLNGAKGRVQKKKLWKGGQADRLSWPQRTFSRPAQPRTPSHCSHMQWGPKDFKRDPWGVQFWMKWGLTFHIFLSLKEKMGT